MALVARERVLGLVGQGLLAGGVGARGGGASESRTDAGGGPARVGAVLSMLSVVAGDGILGAVTERVVDLGYTAGLGDGSSLFWLVCRVEVS